MQQTAVYVGAGLDVRPIRALTHIKKFIYVDTRHDKYFIDRFCQKMEAMNYEWSIITQPTTPNKFLCFNWIQHHNKPTMIECYNPASDKTVIYHVNTRFPPINNHILQTHISEANTLIIAGFHPHKSITSMMKQPVHIACWEGTVYDNDQDDDEDTIVKHMYKDMSNIASLTYYKKRYIPQEFNSIDELEKARKIAI